MKNTTHQTDDEPRRKLSFLRLFVALLFLTGFAYGSLQGWKHLQETKVVASLEPWFAAYVDVTAVPRYEFEQLGTTPAPHIVLSFIVSSPDEACTPTWGGYYTLDEAGVELDLDRRIARLRQQGGYIAVSFGGLLNDEPAVVCTDPEKLVAVYQTVLSRYEIDTIDLDLEGKGLTDKEALARRAVAIAHLQKQHRDEGKNLAVWLTLPVSPQGLTEDGTNAVASMLAGGVDLAGVNVMTMDYGQSKDKADSMHIASQKALTETHRQLGILYKQATISLNPASVWAKIGATPMIGQNDVAGEVFGLDDAKGLNEFALSNGMIRMSMWSANRDIQCGENYVDTKIVSDSCSGVKQDKDGFASLLSHNFTGTPQYHAATVTTQDVDAQTQPIDDPEKSPYQTWKDTGTYLEGTKVVWHGNVYSAKWWTQGDVPDNPVLQSWETPWQLVGPVLPGEKPIPQPTLPPGTYPNWVGTAMYEAGQRVLFDGTPYQAKWWTQGDSPAAASSNADSSPWVPLTQDAIEDIIKQLESVKKTPIPRTHTPEPKQSPPAVAQ